jgi:hypothetical protein
VTWARFEGLDGVFDYAPPLSDFFAGSELECHPFATKLDLARLGGAEFVRSGEHPFQLPVRVERIVVEQHEPS